MFGYIPQNPIVMPGTLRFNLLGSNCTNRDDELSIYLDRLKISIALDERLDFRSNDLSLGVRQLMNLLRVIIENRKIVIMDEPTSSLDRVCQEMFSELLEEHSVGKTVIMIAHRLETLKHFDWIVEMDGGRMKLAGSPNNIL
jgi:ATP-binding cassette subfamily B protein